MCIADAEAEKVSKPVAAIKNLNFSYEAGKKNLVGVNCTIEPNSRIILIGANGAGKSTLMRILTGQIWTNLEFEEFDVCGTAKPNDQSHGIAYLGGTWKRRRTGFEGVCPYTMDCAAGEMMEKWQEKYKERRDELVRVLGINLEWRMHECSDGQRKKVRLMIKLLKPFQLCVIDEFAADLDIFSRKRFFDYLTKECTERGASVLYATHIFDQADEWATHIAFMQLDKTLSPIHHLATYEPYQEILARTGANRAMCPMYVLVLEELERQYRNHSDVFADDDKCFADVIMEEQGKELAGDRHDSEKHGDESGWLDGRLTRQLIKEEKQKAREERANKRRAAEEQEQ
uniref:ABC transporter domain-containing protein n=1 Tax=Amphora coffeiformis TaxID=265554 RepID=A0A7S3L594_9STRA|mmetsp:Transcript_18166/g.34480  ORF Transcript_18166/g.34480 Transcript_18166/m.34480 type:complete len:344 (+) Transcript_18166:133-1164(+)